MPHLPAAGRKSQKPAYRQAGTKVHKKKFEWMFYKFSGISCFCVLVATMLMEWMLSSYFLLHQFETLSSFCIFVSGIGPVAFIRHAFWWTTGYLPAGRQGATAFYGFCLRSEKHSSLSFLRWNVCWRWKKAASTQRRKNKIYKRIPSLAVIVHRTILNTIWSKAKRKIFKIWCRKRVY